MNVLEIKCEDEELTWSLPNKPPVLPIDHDPERRLFYQQMSQQLLHKQQ
jgi:hypothetical protein